MSLTSRADTNCKGLNAVFISGMFDSRSYSAFAMLVSSSDGCCRDGLVAAILLSAAAAMMEAMMLVEWIQRRGALLVSLDGWWNFGGFVRMLGIGLSLKTVTLM